MAAGEQQNSSTLNVSSRRHSSSYHAHSHNSYGTGRGERQDGGSGGGSYMGGDVGLGGHKRPRTPEVGEKGLDSEPPSPPLLRDQDLQATGSTRGSGEPHRVQFTLENALLLAKVVCLPADARVLATVRIGPKRCLMRPRSSVKCVVEVTVHCYQGMIR